MLTTAITEVTPITTPRSVKTLRNLCAHRLAVAIRTASPKAIVVLVAIGVVCSLLLYVGAAQLLSSSQACVAAGFSPASSTCQARDVPVGEGRSRRLFDTRAAIVY